MNSHFTMGLAGLLSTGAIFVGYWGLVLSRQPVVVRVRDVPSFAPLTAADLVLEKLRSAPVASLNSIVQVVSRTLRLAVRTRGKRLLTRYWAGENNSSANFYATNSHLFQFTQLALASTSGGLARNDTVATLHPGIEVIRGNHASQQTP